MQTAKKPNTTVTKLQITNTLFAKRITTASPVVVLVFLAISNFGNSISQYTLRFIEKEGKNLKPLSRNSVRR